MKFKQVGAIKEVFYPEWLANTVVVKKKKREIVGVCRLYGLEQSLYKRPLPPATNRPTGRCNDRPSSNEFLRCFIGILPDTIGTGRLRKDSFCHHHWKLPLQGNPIWSKKCRIHLSKDDN